LVHVTNKFSIINKSGIGKISAERPSGKKHSLGKKSAEQPTERRNANRPGSAPTPEKRLPAAGIFTRRLFAQPEISLRICAT
jgi:hypothetical protein